MVRGGPRSTRNIRVALHGGVSRRSRFSEFLSCEIVDIGGCHKDGSMLTSFVWPSITGAASASNGSLQAASPQMLASLASVAAALSGDSTSATLALSSPASMACIPFIAPGWVSQEDDSRTESSDSDGLSVRARTYQRGLAATCFAQASVATLEFALNDGISGLIGCAVAALGLQASSPTGYRFLPSYIVLAFTNGTMQVLVNSELASHAASLAKSGAVGIKLASVVALASPSLMFVGLAVAWHLHCELRALALQALPPGMRQGLVMAPPVDGLAGPPAEMGAIGQGGAMTQAGGPFRAFAGQSHRLHKSEEVEAK